MGLLLILVFAQTIQSPPLQLVQPPGAAAAPVVITLQDAIDRAKNLDLQFQTAVADAQVATEDRIQAKASTLPSISGTTQYLGTQGNGVAPSGRFVSNDGVHVYRAWGVLHQDLSANTVLLTAYKRAIAGEALAKIRIEIAQRGLNLTVTRNYYALVTAQRRYATAQQAVQQAQRFLELSQEQERLGQAAHADAVKAELQFQQQKLGFEDATLAMESARVTLAVLLFPTFNENFTVVDDLDSAQPLPAFPEIQSMAEKENPDLRAANEALRQATLDVRGAKNAFLPALNIDAVYGIEANAFALHSTVAAAPELGVLPNPGYFITAVLNVPVWDWGALKSRVRQTQVREKQAQLQLTQQQRQLAANLYLFYNEAIAARTSVVTTRRGADLATESLRLTNLRYQAGEASALEVVDAQNAAVQAHNSYDDAQARYRLAISQLQSLTGGF
jgi:outer membrane protein TolC